MSYELNGVGSSAQSGHLISVPSCFWAKGRLSVMDTCLWICSAVIPSQFVPFGHLLPPVFPCCLQGGGF